MRYFAKEEVRRVVEFHLVAHGTVVANSPRFARRSSRPGLTPSSMLSMPVSLRSFASDALLPPLLTVFLVVLAQPATTARRSSPPRAKRWTQAEGEWECRAGVLTSDWFRVTPGWRACFGGQHALCCRRAVGGSD